MKNKLLIQIISFIFVLLLFLTAVYAWFPIIRQTKQIVIITGDVAGEADLYLGKDDNLDGELDKEAGEDIYEVLDPLDIHESLVVSGKKLSYKFIIKNTGTVNAKVELGVDAVSGNNLIKIFAIEGMKYYVSSKSSEIIELTEGKYLPNLIDVDGAYKLPYFIYESLKPNETLTVYFQLTCLGLADLINKYDSSIPYDFIQEINRQIYVDEKTKFNIGSFVVVLKSTPS